MNRLAAAMVFAALSLLSHHAIAQSPSGREVTIPLSRAILLNNALVALDVGAERIVGDKIVKEPFKFDRGVRVALSRNLTALRPIAEGYEKELSVIRSEILGSAQIKDGSPELARLNDENRKLLATEHKVVLYVVRESELKLDSNQVPVATLSALEPIVEFDK